MPKLYYVYGPQLRSIDTADVTTDALIFDSSTTSYGVVKPLLRSSLLVGVSTTGAATVPVQKMNRDGSGQVGFGPALHDGEYLAVGRDGALYVVERLSVPVDIHRIDAAGNGAVWANWTTATHPNTFPWGLIFHPDGSAWSTGFSQYLYKHDRNGSFVAEYDASALSFSLGGLAWGPDGLLYIADNWNTGFIKFNPATNTFSAGGTTATGENTEDLIIVDGVIYATSNGGAFSTHSLFSINLDGTGYNSYFQLSGAFNLRGLCGPCGTIFEYPFRWPQFYRQFLAGGDLGRQAVALLEERDRALEAALGTFGYMTRWSELADDLRSGDDGKVRLAIGELVERDRTLEHRLSSPCLFRYSAYWSDFYRDLLSGDADRVAAAVAVLEFHDRELEDRLRVCC